MKGRDLKWVMLRKVYSWEGEGKKNRVREGEYS
jgi:hypothetical protein